MSREDLRPALRARAEAGLYRTRHAVDGAHRPDQRVDGQTRLAFCSNDYLGLAAHPRVVAALQQGADAYGVGAGASQLINGHHRAHDELESALAEFLGRQRAVLFGTGYMANLGVLTALLGRDDSLFQDRLNHASLLDAGRLTGARQWRYAHGDATALESRLTRLGRGRRLVASDGVFSMDGDRAPLSALARTAQAHAAWLVVDDAHGLGVLGPNGRGVVAESELTEDEVPVLIVTLGKALGTFGAVVTGPDDVIDFIMQHARPYIYTTAPPPALAAATIEALAVLQEEPERRAHLHRLIARWRLGAERLGLALLASDTAIQPVLLGASERALAWSEALEQRGLWVPAIRPPTVPAGQARLRITLSAAHTEAQVDTLLEALEAIAAAEGRDGPIGPPRKAMPFGRPS